MSAAFAAKIDDLTSPKVVDFIADHLRSLADVTVPESRHALNLDGLRHSTVTFWSIWQDRELVGCGALKELDAEHGEVKSMRTASAHLRKGVASFVLQHIVSVAKHRGYRRLSLETGAGSSFAPAHALYGKFGFTACAPFADYREDSNSLFLMREL